MTPQELITRLRYLAEQAPIDAVLFRVPSAPSATYHHMRLDVSPRDVLDLCDYVSRTEQECSALNEECNALHAEIP